MELRYTIIMKIVHITNVFGEFGRGGAENLVARVAAAQAGQGHEVHVFTTVPWNARGVEVLANGIIVHKLFHWCLFLNGQGKSELERTINTVWTFFNVPLAIEVWLQLNKIRPNIIHTHNLAGTSFLIPRLAQNISKHIHTVHDIQLIIPSGRMQAGEEFAPHNHSRAVRMYQRMTRMWFGNPAVVTAASNWLLQYYKSQKYFSRSHMELVRQFFVAAQPPGSIRRARFTILFAGELSESKGVKMLVDWFVKFAHGLYLPLDLFIFGAGPLQEYILAAAAHTPEIHFEGSVAPDVLAEYMRSSHVVVVPSLIYENSPNVVIEALACHTPVSVSDIGGAAELIAANPQNGWVVEPTTDAWEAHLTWLVQNQQAVLEKDPVLLSSADAATHFLNLYEQT